MTIFREGDRVAHHINGLGKVVQADGAIVRVYFKGAALAGGTDWTRAFPQDTPHLSIRESVPDEELDNLPPFRDGAFSRPKTPFDFETLLRRFEQHFPDGLNDPGFVDQEKSYKLAAHQRYQTGFAPGLGHWIESRDDQRIAEELDRVYGDPKIKSGPDTRLNLMYQSIDEPAFFDALRAGGERTVDFADSAYRFVQAPSKSTFDAYANALRALPRKKNGSQHDGWTVATWFPFIADPENNIVIKPTLFRELASAVCYDLQYSSELEWKTYSSCLAFSRRLRDLLADSRLNLSRMSPDLLDVQSFMWVVARYSGQDSH